MRICKSLKWYPYGYKPANYPNKSGRSISMFPAERVKKGIKHWLGPDAEIIHDKMFGRAIERLHAGGKIDDLPLHLKRK
jgi:hypothetical protein